MSFVDKVKNNADNPLVYLFIGLGIAGYFIADYYTDNLVLSLVIGALVGGFTGLLYNDYTEKQKIKGQEDIKREEILRKKREQAQAEEQEGKCISCLTPLPEGAEECPKCGFEVRHYNIDEEEDE